ncbi:MAG: endonuclease/exonuclease/phosphatase, partial [candidate division Zixibacteria bacterium]
RAEWRKITDLYEQSAESFGLPERRDDSVVIGTFNIRELGTVKKRSDEAWELLSTITKRFDLMAVQEIQDKLEGFEYLAQLAGDDYGSVVSDVTGVKPGGSGNPERLGFLFNWRRVQRTAMASDITFDRSEITRNLYENRDDFSAAWSEHTERLDAWEIKCEEKKAEGKKKPTKPGIRLPRFLSFIRQPHYVSFRIEGAAGTEPYEFLVVNAHLLYGQNKDEREWEFRALVEWMTIRAKKPDRLYHPNLLLLGDCNLDFDSDITVMRDDIDLFMKGLNKTVLRSRKAAKVNFPILSEHPERGKLRTALRQEQTYDQIGIFARDKRLPTPNDNDTAGTVEGEFDYGVFNIGDLIAMALHNKPIAELTIKQQRAIFEKAEFDISDHMPVWMRLKLPV